MFKNYKSLIVTLCFCSFLFFNFRLAQAFNSKTTEYWKVIKSDENGLVIDCHFPRPELKNVEINRKNYQEIILDGLESFSIPGQPRLPGLRIPFFAPANAELSLEYKGKPLHLTLNAPPVPIPFQNIKETEDQNPQIISYYSEDPIIYKKRAWYPKSPASLDTDSFFRQTRICSVLIEPIRVNIAEKRADYYSDLIISISFENKHQQKKQFTIKDDQTSLLPFYTYMAPNSDDLINGKIPLLPKSENLKDKQITSSNVVGDFYKVGIHETGMHKITYNDLDVSGFPVDSVNPQHLALYKNTQEIAIIVIGEDDGVFNNRDILIFYGTGVGNEYVDSNIYWLTDKGSSGLRMADIDATVITPYQEVTVFSDSIFLEQNTRYWSSIPNGTGLDHWFWGDHYIAPEIRDYQFDLIYPDGTGTVELRIGLQGKSYSLAHNPDHHVQVSVNSTLTGDHNWDGQIPTEIQQDLDVTYFQTGQNTVTIEADNETGAPVDSFYLNYIDVTYPRQFITETDELPFILSGIGSQRIVIQGYSNDGISVYDVSNSELVGVLVNTTVIEDTGSYSVIFGQDIAEQHHYISLCSSQLKVVDYVTYDAPSDLMNTDNGADLIIVAPNTFFNALQPLVQHRQNQGYRVSVVDIQNIYDEFSDGLMSPQALTDFFQYAYDYWQGPPVLGVLLVGEANVDYHNYMGTTIPNIVPTALIEVSTLGQTISDHEYSLVSGGDELPDIFIGRITASTRSDVEEFVSKVIGYETQSTFFNWNNNVLLVADSYSIYESYLDTLETSYFNPSGMVTNKVYLSTYGSNVSQAKQDIITEINSGRLFCFYLGHGAFENWSGQYLLVNSDINYFNNGYRQTLLVASTCLNGYFGHYNVETSLSEEWIRHQMKGAIITSSSTATTSEHDSNKYHHRLLEQVITNNQTIAALAVFEAEIMAYLYDAMSLNHLKSMSVLGDPLTVIRVPGSSPEALMSFDQDSYYTESSEAVITLWDADANTDSFSIDTISVHIISQSDLSGLNLTLVETGINTGVFSSDDPLTNNLTFSQLVTIPSQGTILVTSGDWLQSIYQNGSPLQTHVATANWYLSQTPSLSLSGFLLLLLLFSLLIYRLYKNVDEYSY